MEHHANRQSTDQLNREPEEVNDFDDKKSDDSDEIKKENYALVSNPVFRRIFFVIRFLGCLVSFASLITELAYLFTHRFSSLTYWILYMLACFFRVLIPLIWVIVSLRRKVIGKKPKSYLYDVD